MLTQEPPPPGSPQKQGAEIIDFMNAMNTKTSVVLWNSSFHLTGGQTLLAGQLLKINTNEIEKDIEGNDKNIPRETAQK